MRVELEQGPEASTLRPGGVLVHGLDAETLAIDVRLVHTLQSSMNLAYVHPANSPKRWNNGRFLSARLSAGGTDGLSHRSQWKR